MPISKKKFSYTLNLEEKLKKVKPSKKKEVAELIGLELVDAIGEHLDSQKSPVSGGSYKKGLSKDYAKKKGSNIADLFNSGSMLGDLQVKATKKDVTLKITNSTQKKKSFNHNTGDTLPTRKFMPDDSKGEKFKKTITARINRIIEDGS